MVKIEWDEAKPDVIITWQGDSFSDLLDVAHRLNLRFDPKRKVWIGLPAKVQEYIEEFQVYDQVSIDEYSRRKISAYIDSVTELRVITNRAERLKFIPDLMGKPPILDKVCEGDPLKSYQVLDSVFLMNRNRGIASHATGMGKSYILTAILEHLRYYKLARKSLIFSSNIGIVNLRNEIVKLGTTIRPEDALVVSSVDDVEDRDVFNHNKYPQSIIVIGYDTFRHISDYYDKTIHNRAKKVKYVKSSVPIKGWLESERGVLFLDECHYLGSPASLRTKAISMIKDHFEYRYEMSATFAPVYEKMYAPLSILDAGLVRGLGYYDWLREYVELGNKWSKYAINQDTWNHKKLDELNRQLYVKYAVKRDRETYLDLPPLIHEPVLKCKWTKRHRRIYEAFCGWFAVDVTKRAQKSNAGLVREFTNGFQFAMLAVENPTTLLSSARFGELDPSLQKDIQSFSFERDHSKLKVFSDVLADRCDESEEKVIVYFYHPATKDHLEAFLKKRHPRVVSAELSRTERMEEVEAFKRDSKSQVLLCSIKCASTSITVTEAKAIVFFETGWDGVDYEQACGRIHRPGQDSVTRIYDLRLEDSFDELQMDNLSSKGETIKRLLSKESLSPDEWRATFSYHSIQD